MNITVIIRVIGVVIDSLYFCLLKA